MFTHIQIPYARFNPWLSVKQLRVFGVALRCCDGRLHLGLFAGSCPGHLCILATVDADSCVKLRVNCSGMGP